jgi:hypothetical protein
MRLDAKEIVIAKVPLLPGVPFIIPEASPTKPFGSPLKEKTGVSPETWNWQA